MTQETKRNADTSKTINETKQTAVEWLIEKQMDAGIGLPKEWREQAKEMEKEQIMDAFNTGDKFSADYFDGLAKSEAKNYYNETYGGNK